ncbi:integrase [Methylobacterium brachiatum]|uniref:Integrase n=1 Tax=Methylobacterium brachiatum TaxID=269660 RepID=A0AAJ1U0L2_9HYPH|nr:tyrosine-type recombinase/integrase [Methylobacterium brachiatum]MCB4805875.1 tyrosine-type recombinase/integrase [Methylobacterium brachiatum]MDQ0547148.1 integrase [Methylobacterium brachiatum]
MAESHGVWKPQNSSTYYCSFTVAGTRFNGSTKLTSKREAIAFARRWKDSEVAKHKQEVATGEKDMPFLEAVTRFMSEVGDHFFNAQLYEMHYDWLVERIGEKTPLTAINDDMVTRLLAERRKCHRFKRRDAGPISERYAVMSVIDTLAAVLTRARRFWSVPLTSEPNWKQYRVAVDPRTRTMTMAEELLIEKNADADMWALVEFILLTALRRKDALIRWSQVDWGANLIRLTTKRKKAHEIRITPEIRRLLDYAGDEGRRHPEFVWTCEKEARHSIRGRVPVTYNAVHSRWKTVTRRAGITGLTIHDLRRTAGERMYRATGDIKAVSKFMGHRNSAVTEAFYVHVVPDHVELRQLAMEYARKVMRERAMLNATVH